MEFKRLKLSQCKIVSRKYDIFYNASDKKGEIVTPYPIIVEKDDKNYNLLYGFSKYKHYKNNSYQYVPAYILGSTAVIDKIQTIIRYQRAQRSLYPIEIAKVIDL